MLATYLVHGLIKRRRLERLPILPTPVAASLLAAYLVLVTAAIHQLWRKTREGYVLAVILGAVQLIRFAVFAGPGVSALWIGEALLYPALIAVCLWLVFQTRPPRPAPPRPEADQIGRPS